MGSIFGLFQRHEGAASPVILDAMSKALAHRIADRSWHWSAGAFAIGAHLLHRSPGAELEKAPDPLGSERYVIACDSRIDNIEQIVGDFGLDRELRCDSEVILELYKSCGKTCVDHLLGGFAFAIVDREKSEIFCARDHFGEKPFTYFLSDGLFAFASEPRAIVSAGISSGNVNDARIADFLLGSINDKATTIHEAVHRLPPAHSLTVTAQGCKIEAYWKLAIPTATNPATDDEIAARFRELLEQAVECRLRSDMPVGSMLSGGIDSAAITMLARRGMAKMRPGKPVTAFSATFPDVPACDEQEWIALIEQEHDASLAPLTMRKLRADIIGPVDHADALVRCADEPIIASNQFMLWALMDLAQRSGMGIMLTGHDGDTVVSHGFAWLTELTLDENWDGLELELERMADLIRGYGNARRSLLHNYVLPGLKVLRTRLALFQLVRTVFALRNKFSIPYRELLSVALPGWIIDMRRKLKGQVDSGNRVDLARRFKASAIFRQRQRMSGDIVTAGTSDEHLRGLVSPLITETFETFDRLGAQFGIEMRHPFFDKRLVEYCLSLPREQKIRDGWARFVMRQALVGILPEAIRLRRDKSNLGHNFAVSLLKDIDRIRAAFQTNAAELGRYWDTASLESVADRYCINPNGVDAQTLHLAYTHALWLQTRSATAARK